MRTASPQKLSSDEVGYGGQQKAVSSQDTYGVTLMRAHTCIYVLDAMSMDCTYMCVTDAAFGWFYTTKKS